MKKEVREARIENFIGEKQVDDKEFFSTFPCSYCGEKGIKEIDIYWNKYECKNCKKIF